jgi:hypothetical protein
MSWREERKVSYFLLAKRSEVSQEFPLTTGALSWTVKDVLRGDV